MSEWDDFAMSTFEIEDQKMCERQVQSENEEKVERWWIVLHAKVAVRQAPTTEGKPVCVLPGGSVVRVSKIVRANGARWIVLHDDDLPMLIKKKKKAEAEGEAAPPPAPGCCMMIESATAGTLVMTAPREFNWENLAHLPPRERGEAARRHVLGAQAELSDEQIERLLGQADEQLAQREKKPQAPPASDATKIRFDEAVDGLVDLSVNEPPKPRVPPPPAPPPARAPPQRPPVQLMNAFDRISYAHGLEQRGANKESREEYDRKKAEEEAIERQKQWSKFAREKAMADDLGEAGPIDDGSHGQYLDRGLPMWGTEEFDHSIARYRGGEPGKGPAYH